MGFADIPAQRTSGCFRSRTAARHRLAEAARTDLDLRAGSRWVVAAVHPFDAASCEVDHTVRAYLEADHPDHYEQHLVDGVPRLAFAGFLPPSSLLSTLYESP